MLTDKQWAMLEPLIEACRPKGKTPPQDLRRTLSAILWRHQNGATASSFMGVLSLAAAFDWIKSQGREQHGPRSVNTMQVVRDTNGSFVPGLTLPHAAEQRTLSPSLGCATLGVSYMHLDSAFEALPGRDSCRRQSSRHNGRPTAR
ncbi:hypothetical protein MAE02_46570 [Microvirga aerophila]|uniref:Insertion element IS402-like domain-containing protein n=1 Tax=Microvirga aerophila TaxID=670291 RepID=A0A512BYC6_9HYPH|nr:hypothetical protein MAE02_46570 [Microvirga aerophila]